MNVYAEVMQNFYDSVNHSIENDPEKLAKAYANFFWESGYRGKVKNLPKPETSITSIGVVSENTPLSFVTKKVFLVSDTAIITQQSKKKNLFNVYRDMQPTPMSNAVDQSCFLASPDLIELGNWLKECKPILIRGDIFYYPNIIVDEIEEPAYVGGIIERSYSATLDDVRDVAIVNKKLVEITNASPAKIDVIRPVLEIELPSIENISLEDFCKIAIDEEEATERFKDFLRLKLLNLDQQSNESSFDKQILKMSLEIRDGVREISSQYNEMKRKRTFQATGAVIAATTAVLVAINSSAWGYLPNLLGAGSSLGGLAALGKAIQDYSNNKSGLQNSPYYFLWLISKDSHRA